MPRRQEMDSSILEAAKQFDAQRFVEAVQGDFADFPDHRINRKRVAHPIWHLVLVTLCGFFCGCNTVGEIAE
jgi:hypothetical protein